MFNEETCWEGVLCKQCQWKGKLYISAFKKQPIREGKTLNWVKTPVRLVVLCVITTK